MQPLKPLLRQGFQPFQREKSSTSRDGDASKRKIEEDTSGKSKSNRQRSRRIDFHEIIVLERSGTFQH
ncbi:hypothetical protein B5F88_18520 [Flavonifractor sp. An306]|nr:hypothetical protein B5F88_18520 [Flavonifractor sp. An306]